MVRFDFFQMRDLFDVIECFCKESVLSFVSYERVLYSAPVSSR